MEKSDFWRVVPGDHDANDSGCMAAIFAHHCSMASKPMVPEGRCYIGLQFM